MTSMANVAVILAGLSSILEPAGTIASNAGRNFSEISSVVVAKDGTIFISDRYAFSVRSFNRSGFPMRTVGRRGKGPGEFAGGPGPLALMNDTLAVVDLTTNRVCFFTRQLGFAGECVLPVPANDIALDRRGWVYAAFLASVTGSNVRVFDKSGAMLRAFTPRSAGSDRLFDAVKIATSPDGMLVAAFGFRNAIEIFAPDETDPRVLQLPEYPLRATEAFQRTRALGVGLRIPVEPVISDVGIDHMGRIWVMGGRRGSLHRREIFVFSSSGALLARHDFRKQMGGMSVGNDGCIYVSNKEYTELFRYRIVEEMLQY